MQQGGILDEFKDAWKKPNNELIQIILINIIVFALLKILWVFLSFTDAKVTYELVLRKLMLPSSIDLFIFQPWTLFTYGITHEGWLHIIFNMLWLYWFGKLIVEYLGSQKLFVLYALGVISGGLLYMLIYNLAPLFANEVETSMMLGASAGVYAVVVGAAVLMPNYTFFLLLIGPVRIKYIAIVFVFLSFTGIVGTNAGGNLAHMGGALIGFVYIRQLQKGNDLGTWVVSIVDFFKGVFSPKPKIKVSYRGKGRSSRASGSMSEQDEIDAILDKISQSGYESLTKEEKQKLFNASKK